jgi:hypothetical protein
LSRIKIELAFQEEIATMNKREQLKERACALSRGFLLVHQYDQTLGLAFCKGFLLAVRELNE